MPDSLGGSETDAEHELAHPTGSGRPLQIAALIKQVPVAESLALGEDGRLRRQETPVEMNPYCRRAVAQGVAMARVSGGSCVVFTLGPPGAEDVLREAIAWGADRGVHLCDPAFAGSDTLATARALADALQGQGRFDLVILGRNSIDGETGQVGPELAQILDLPFATGVRRLQRVGDRLALELEHDDGYEEVEISMPAVVSAAERLCDPCKVDPDGRRAVAAEKIERISVEALPSGPFGAAGSPTVVGRVRTLSHDRQARQLSGALQDQVREAVAVLVGRNALRGSSGDEAMELEEEAVRSVSSGLAVAVAQGSAPLVAVVLEEGRDRIGAELLGGAARLAAEVGGTVTALTGPGAGDFDGWGAAGADELVVLDGSLVAEDVANGLIAWSKDRAPWVVLAPSTAFGREVAARAAAAVGAGLVGDAIAVDVVDGVFVAAKPAFSGAQVADITCRSPVQLATIRPGVLTPVPARTGRVTVVHRAVVPRQRVRILAKRRDDDIEVLARADAVIGVGSGVAPDDYPQLSTLAALLGAELAATRKVTDQGWAPRARQVGITGRSIAPRLYVALGLSGKFNHMVGVRGAGTILAINSDPAAPVFGFADVGIVGDWRQVLSELETALRGLSEGVLGAGNGVTPPISRT